MYKILRSEVWPREQVSCPATVSLYGPVFLVRLEPARTAIPKRRAAFAPLFSVLAATPAAAAASEQLAAAKFFDIVKTSA
jgi:hypothetical protein